MAFKIIGQSAPAATTDTTVYTVPAGKSAVLSTVSVPSGATLANQHYVAYEAVLPAYSTDYHRAGFTLAAGDFVVARCSTTDLSVVICGDES